MDGHIYGPPQFISCTHTTLPITYRGDSYLRPVQGVQFGNFQMTALCYAAWTFNMALLKLYIKLAETIHK